MTRLKYVIKELFRNIYRNPGTTFGSFLSLALLFLLFDIFWIAAGTSDELYSKVVSGLKVEVFLPEYVDDAAVTGLIGDISRLNGVRDVEYLSREQARKELASLVGVDLLVDYDTLNPLPRSLSLSIEAEWLTSSSMEHLSDTLKKVSGSSSVFYSKTWLAKAEQTKRVFSNAGLALGLLIFLAALVGSANNVRMLARVRNVALRQLVLVGAGRMFATMPYIIEGLLLSGLAASVGWAVLLYGHERVEFSQFTIFIPPRNELSLFIALCALLGAVSGFLGARRMLK